MFQSNDAAKFVLAVRAGPRHPSLLPLTAARSTRTRQIVRNFAPEHFLSLWDRLSSVMLLLSLSLTRQGICGEHRTCYFPKWAGTVRGPRRPQRRQRRRRRWRRRQSNLEGTRVLFKTNAGSLLKYLLLLQNVLAGPGRAEQREDRRGANRTEPPNPGNKGGVRSVMKSRE